MVYAICGYCSIFPDPTPIYNRTTAKRKNWHHFNNLSYTIMELQSNRIQLLKKLGKKKNQSCDCKWSEI